MKKLPNKFIYPVAIVMIFDFLFTLIGQPAKYWSNYSFVYEGSPLGFNFLKINPLIFIIFCLIYLMLMIFLIKKLPLILSEILALSLFVGHIWGSSSWLPVLAKKVSFTPFEFSYWYLNIFYFIFIAIVSVLIINKSR